MLNVSHKILVINPGSTSSKIALFDGERLTAQESIRVDQETIDEFSGIWEQYDLRLKGIHSFIQSKSIKRLDAVVGRGGLLKPVPRGTFEINDVMLQDARIGVQGTHISNLGCALAHEIAVEFNCPSFVVDPVSVDEFLPIARYSGHPVVQRRPLSHALNLRAGGYMAAKKMQKKLGNINLLVAHLGGGISICPLQGGRIVDVNDASSSGPFSPDRSGTLPLTDLIDLCFSGEYDRNSVKRMVNGEGGLKAYLGTTDLEEIEQRIKDNDARAEEVVDAMIYQIAKEIGAMSTVLFGKIDGIVLTGGLVNSKRLVNRLVERIKFIAPVHIFPGEFEMEAMAAGALRILTGEEAVSEYV